MACATKQVLCGFQEEACKACKLKRPVFISFYSCGGNHHGTLQIRRSVGCGNLCRHPRTRKGARQICRAVLRNSRKAACFPNFSKPGQTFPVCFENFSKQQAGIKRGQKHEVAQAQKEQGAVNDIVPISPGSKRNKNLENPGIDPGASRMRSGRSTNELIPLYRFSGEFTTEVPSALKIPDSNLFKIVPSGILSNLRNSRPRRNNRVGRLGIQK